MKKQYRKPQDETKDHMNFLQHVAGLNNEVQVENSKGGTYDSGVSTYGDAWVIKKPTGRLPFNANLLTIGQVKFHPKKLAKQVKAKLAKQLAGGMTNNFNLSNSRVALKIFDEVYSIFENRRCAKKASEHFHRPKIWRDHIKDVKSLDAESGYLRGVHHLRGNKGDDYELRFGWFRQYLYQNATLRDIKDPIIEDICRKHKDAIARVRDSVNPTTSILAALEIASRFHLEKEEDTAPQDVAPNVSTEDVVAETVKAVTDAVVQESKQGKDNAERMVAGVPEIEEDATFEDVVSDEVENKDAIESAEKLTTGNKCGAEIIDDSVNSPFETNVRLDSQELEGALDRNSRKISASGHRVSRNAWRLPALGDPNIFVKHPQTATEMVILVDMSQSMGGTRSKFSRMHKALSVTTAVMDRFPDTKAYGFTGGMGHTNRTKGGNAVLFPILPNTYPDISKGNTPLCGAMKGLEENIDLTNAKVLIITDGEPNNCYTGGPANTLKEAERKARECVASRANAWGNKGIRFATMYLQNVNGSYGKDMNKHPLPVELSIQHDDFDEITNHDITQVLTFFKG